MPVPPPTPYDPWLSLQDPAFKTAVEAGDWSGVRTSLEAFSDDRLEAALNLIMDADGAEEWLERALAADPTDHVAKTALGARYIKVGWTIRSAARAKYVSNEQFEQFHGWLTRAEELLTEVCAEHPDHLPAWYFRLVTARGLELGQAEARRRYDKVAAINPQHTGAQLTYLQQIVPKWGGSWETAEAFAAECRQAVPLGSPSRALLLDVLIERWADDTTVKPDLTALPEIAAETVQHPDHQPGIWGADVHSRLAVLYSLGKRPKRAAPHFQALNAFPSRRGWDYLKDSSYNAFYELAFDPDMPDNTERAIAIGKLIYMVPVLVIAGLLALGSLAMTVLYGVQNGEVSGTLGWAVIALVSGLIGWVALRGVRKSWRDL